MKEDKIKPRILLDKVMLGSLNEFYSSKLSDQYLNNECFSHPDLESHICNIKYPLDGGKECTYCKHIVGRRCHVTCHIHHFCLAVFAYRLGIGGEDMSQALKNNTTKTSFNKLQQQVVAALKVEDDEDFENTLGDAAQDISRVELNGDEKQAASSNKVEEDFVDTSKEDELISIREAANLYGCSYYNMYSHAKKGHIGKIEKSGTKQFVKKSSVLALKAKKNEVKEPKVVKPVEKKEVNSDSLVCLCGKQLKSKPGFTLHQKVCKVFNNQV